MWLRAEFFKRKIQTLYNISKPDYDTLWTKTVFVPKNQAKYYRRLQKCKLLRTMYAN